MEYLAPEPSEPEDIPKINSPVWILGRRYNAIQGILILHCFSFSELLSKKNIPIFYRPNYIHGMQRSIKIRKLEEIFKEK